ncbi:thiamine S protein [Methanofollis formosanus]|uniref:Thiamine S protein n=1 Tax=Methanofollis formosanus TaxID=299308 RepID=A0A8G1EGA3_9EURY|nr:thiamine S protein [Methanofollis formosanus]QYZ79590.1 thiamine S protein [Methanofollis formosanus]
MECTLRFPREGVVLTYHGEEGDTWEKALLCLGVNPDIVIVFVDGRPVAQDDGIKTDEAEIVSTCSRG